MASIDFEDENSLVRHLEVIIEGQSELLHTKDQRLPKITEINTGVIDSFMIEGNKYFVQGEYEEAITYYDKALTIDSAYVDALNNKGNALYFFWKDIKKLCNVLKIS